MTPLAAHRRLPWIATLALITACWQTTAAPTPPSPATPTAPTPVPPRTAPADPIVELASQWQHTCARRQSGSVLCWGSNTHGQLGDGTREASARGAKPAQVAGLQDAVELAVGSNFSCARRKAGGVVCWGNNEFGQLGDGRGTKPGALSLRPVAVAGLRQPIQLTAGEVHACALEQSGTVQCWGDSRNGQVGSDAQRAFAKPIPIEQLGPVSRVAAGASHVCALETAGLVRCWGRNTEGQLGDGKSGSRIKPVLVANLEDAVDLASGHRHTCARQRSGRVWCWGDNASAQLGANAGRDPKRGTPVEVGGLAGGVVELAGGGDHTCARLQSGRAMCWGSNAAGQLGQRGTVTRMPTPTAVRGMGDAIDLALGQQHTCALRKTGEIACVGSPEPATRFGTI